MSNHNPYPVCKTFVSFLLWIDKLFVIKSDNNTKLHKCRCRDNGATYIHVGHTHVFVSHFIRNDLLFCYGI